MNVLKKLALALALAAAIPLALAQFRPGMTLAEIEAEVATQVAAGRTVNEVAGDALGAGLEPGLVTAAMINAGVAPLVAIGAVLNTGGPREAVRAGALAAGVPINEVVAMINYWIPGTPGGLVGASVTTSSETSAGVSGLGGGGGGQLASPN